jgi:hypothetical protein
MFKAVVGFVCFFVMVLFFQLPEFEIVRSAIGAWLSRFFNDTRTVATLMTGGIAVYALYYNQKKTAERQRADHIELAERQAKDHLILAERQAKDHLILAERQAKDHLILAERQRRAHVELVERQKLDHLELAKRQVKQHDNEWELKKAEKNLDKKEEILILLNEIVASIIIADNVVYSISKNATNDVNYFERLSEQLDFFHEKSRLCESLISIHFENYTSEFLSIKKRGSNCIGSSFSVSKQSSDVEKSEASNEYVELRHLVTDFYIQIKHIKNRYTS